MNYWAKLLLWSMGASLLTLASCSKSTELGLSLVEQERDIVYTDSLTLDFSTVLPPPSQTQNRSTLVCGAYVDPIFGLATAGSYFNFRIPSTDLSFPNASFDSVVLSLDYSGGGHYGDIRTTPSPQTWEVLRMSESIEENTFYYSDSDFGTSDVLASNVTFTPSLTDSVSLFGTNLPPQLRIRLDDAFGQSLLQPSDTTIYESNSAFKEFFKGVYLRPVAGANNNSCILRFDGRSLQTKITVFYTEPDGNGGIIQRSLEFLRDEDAESVSVFDHDYTGTSVLDNNSSDSIVYIQGMDGGSLKIEFPEIQSLGSMIINKAELLISAVDTGTQAYPVPNQLVSMRKTSDGQLSLTEDVVNAVNKGNTNIYGGFLIPTTGNNWAYQARIELFLQKLVDGELNEDALYLVPASALDPARVLLFNQQHPTLKAKLFLTYTKIN